MFRPFLATLFLSLASASVILPRNGWKIPSTSFDSQGDFDKYYSYNYPWGTDHNGGARMDNSNVKVSGGQLTLTATPVSGQKATSSGLAINYLSGTVYAKEHFTVAKSGGYDFQGQFQAPTAKGTWPAFWLTGANGWPPEIDLAEWKGSGKVSFNTYGMDKKWSTKDVSWGSASAWRTVLVKVRDKNGSDVSIEFYLDGSLVTTQTGNKMVGQPFWLIFDLQMEGSSGSPGPKSQTTFAIKNFQVYSYNP